ncbi:ABC transporter substrate-binding protein [Cryptosporangium phraense]|uniref:ABC transporter substrate-binding protein n=1 Tax=Cryptosporangium phraense TaxID=2593070 RepID=A0A545AX97_9ACTN|nr:ABC transporter substrate-binding protein [Cryptosporangium phraense]TQS45956.1 ABC transporter substrate-binding protein [Cryptosporangium phraense]
MRRPIRFTTVAVLAVALAAAGCTKNTGDKDEGDQQEASTQTAVLAENSDGPAPGVPGAKKGGTVTVYTSGDFEHLDPQQAYVIPALTAGTNLMWRTLTQFRENGDGKLEVVGDLATNTGEESNGGKTWKFTLKDGLKFEDGTPITSKDVAYGVARSFSPDLTEGPKWFQQWLAGSAEYNKVYKGPYDGGAKVPPGVEVPDDKTIIFNFKTPHADVPFAATMPTTSPVPAAKDTKAQYENHPVSSGPYKIQTYNRSQKMTLVRNENWDPNTDPIRHNFPDSYVFEFTRTAEQASEALLADAGEAQSGLSFQDEQVPASVYPKVIANPDAKKRILTGPTQFVWMIDINLQRVKDINVRKALNYALDREGMLKVWGSFSGLPATTILSPTTSGYEDFNLYDGGKNGNVEKAKELLGGKRVPLTYAYRNTERNQAIAAFLRSSLKNAGFDLTIQPVDEDQYYTVLGRRDNPFDLYLQGWGSDWPGGSTTIPPLFDGRAITPTGNQNITYMNDDTANQKMDEILALTDQTQADKQWAALDKDIMTRVVPIVPAIYDKQTTMYGSKIGGIYLSAPYGNSGLNNLYVK